MRRARRAAKSRLLVRRLRRQRAFLPGSARHSTNNRLPKRILHSRVERSALRVAELASGRLVFPLLGNLADALLEAGPQSRSGVPVSNTSRCGRLGVSCASVGSVIPL